MKARYLGSPSRDDDGPRRVEFAGATFPRGLFVPVDHLNDPSHAGVRAKLVANPHFETSDDAMTKAEEAALAELMGEDEGEDAEPAAPTGKAQLIAALEALQAKHPDLKFNPKASAEKLQGALEAARFEYGDDD